MDGRIVIGGDYSRLLRVQLLRRRGLPYSKAHQSGVMKTQGLSYQSGMRRPMVFAGAKSCWVPMSGAFNPLARVPIGRSSQPGYRPLDSAMHLGSEIRIMRDRDNGLFMYAKDFRIAGEVAMYRRRRRLVPKDHRGIAAAPAALPIDAPNRRAIAAAQSIEAAHGVQNHPSAEPPHAPTRKRVQKKGKRGRADPEMRICGIDLSPRSHLNNGFGAALSA